MVHCIFWEICLFHPNLQIYWPTFINTAFHFPCNICRFWNNVPFLIPDIGNLCFLPFFFISFIRDLAILWIFSKNQLLALLIFSIVYFPQYFSMKIFRHTDYLRELHSEHPFTHHLESTVVTILLYLLCQCLSVHQWMYFCCFKVSDRHRDTSLLNTSACMSLTRGQYLCTVLR